MNRYHRAILELSIIVQPGDALTLASGGQYISMGSAINPCDHMKRERGGIASPMRYAFWMMGWMVSVQAVGFTMPVALSQIAQIKRGNAIIWSLTGERTPIQMELFA
jgi:hypothetical protein